MNYEERQKHIENLKAEFKDNDEFVKNGRKYHRFTIQEIKLPKSLGKPYLNIMYDEKDNAYVVLNVLEGVTPEEREKKRKIVEEKRRQRREEVTKHKLKVTKLKQKLRENMKQMNFSVCEEMKLELDNLEKEYREKFGRKKQ
jgi:hypothetical protein